mmetsp:Transcript_9481/g.15603  ORF Transcript_9481/g.15603 Transcript_9481/m.15603 type:complete len:84 (+) Transcript_9481:676-927(+)
MGLKAIVLATPVAGDLRAPLPALPPLSSRIFAEVGSCEAGGGGGGGVAWAAKGEEEVEASIAEAEAEGGGGGGGGGGVDADNW